MRKYFLNLNSIFAMKKVLKNLHKVKVDERKIAGSFEEMHIVQPPQMKLYADE